MSFKDQLQNDLMTFFNIEEFAEFHVIDGDEHPCIIESLDLSERKGLSQDVYDLTDGIFLNAIVLYIQSKLIRRPDIDQPVDIDGQVYYVKSVSDQMGVLKIGLEMNDI